MLSGITRVTDFNVYKLKRRESGNILFSQPSIAFYGAQPGY
jgi:hypothetical protein